MTADSDAPDEREYDAEPTRSSAPPSRAPEQAEARFGNVFIEAWAGGVGPGAWDVGTDPGPPL
jgi:hypothetical protein